MVTATGIFLGFMLNFTSEWTRQTLSIQKLRDVVLAIGIIVSLALLLLTLVRTLSLSYPANPYRFYRKTLLFFLIGIFIPFVAFIIVIAEKFVVSFFR